MSSETFTLKILTPAGLALEKEVLSVNLPSSEGEIGILPGHVRYSGLLGTGVLTYVSASDSKEGRLVVSEGFVDFANNILSILADSVEFAESADKASLPALKEALIKELNMLDPSDPDWNVKSKNLAKIEAVQTLL